MKLQSQHIHNSEFLFANAAVGSINTTDGTQVSEEQGGAAQCYTGLYSHAER
jgi:hypothetical protein